MFAIDLVAFGTRRDDDVQTHLREEMYRITETACRAAGLPWPICHHEDRGDGLFLIAPACVSAEMLLDPLTARMQAGIRRHNKLASTSARIQMRMAIHAGHVRFDAHGATGAALLHLFRLLHAQVFKTAARRAHTEFALVTSDYLYEEIIRHGPGLIDPHAFRKATIINKETRATAWIRLSHHPGHPFKPRPAAAPASGLTREELDIAVLLASGRSRRQITQQLRVPAHQVDAGIRRVLTELAVTTGKPDDLAAALAERLQEITTQN